MLKLVLQTPGRLYKLSNKSSYIFLASVFCNPVEGRVARGPFLALSFCTPEVNSCVAIPDYRSIHLLQKILLLVISYFG